MLVQQNTDHGFDSLNHTPDPAPFQTKVKRRRKPMTREVLKARGAKIAAAKLAKRATLQCETCSNPFRVARHDLWRKRCPACVRLGKRLSKKKIHAKTCPVCKAPFTAARAKTICCSVKCARYDRAGTTRPAVTGHKIVNPEEWRRAVKSKERGERSPRQTPAGYEPPPEAGVSAHTTAGPLSSSSDPRTTGSGSCKTSPASCTRTKAFSTLCRAIHAHRRGTVHREGFRAFDGLATIGRGFRQSWRGWTWVSKQEGREGIDNMSELQPSVNEQKDDSS